MVCTRRRTGARVGRRHRIAYVSGPIDASKVYREWRSRQASDYFGTIYLVHLYALLDEFAADGLIITTLPGARSTERLDHLTIVNLPMPSGRGRTGALYHVAMFAWAVRCMVEIVRYRANAALLTAGQDYFWVFRPLRLFGIRLLASLHCTLWPKFAPRKKHHLFLTWLNGRLFYPACDHIQGVSEEAVAQIVSCAPSIHDRPRRFIATYDPARFEQVLPASWPPSGEPFRLLYVGRIEVNKGVLDLAEVMRRLEEREPSRFKLDICGEGPAEEELKRAVEQAKLASVINVRGQCNTGSLAKLYAECHAVVVPTRSDFEEGTPKVAFEAVLNLRPVVMSAACPALADVAAATVEPKVDDVEDYVRAIGALSDDPELYAEKVAAAGICRLKHFDERHSYGAVLRAGLQPLLAAPSSQ
jgi:glycogen(starch) synthase